MTNHSPEHYSVLQLSELMRGLEIPPVSASLEPGQLYLIGEAIAKQAKEVATVTAQRDELLALIERVINGDLPQIALCEAIAKCEAK